MPTYDYVCGECGHAFEELQSIKAEPLKDCPKCGMPALRRLVTGGSGMIFKGSGFYLTDYGKAGGGKAGVESKSPAKPASKSESKAESKPDAKPASDSGSTTEPKKKSGD